MTDDDDHLIKGFVDSLLLYVPRYDQRHVAGMMLTGFYCHVAYSQESGAHGRSRLHFVRYTKISAQFRTIVFGKYP